MNINGHNEINGQISNNNGHKCDLVFVSSCNFDHSICDYYNYSEYYIIQYLISEYLNINGHNGHNWY